jgi:hypothetical protein
MTRELLSELAGRGRRRKIFFRRCGEGKTRMGERLVTDNDSEQ